MEKIAKLSDMMHEEIADAKKYAKCALKAKDTDPQDARVFAELANQELGHADKLHNMVVEVMRAGNVPESMQYLWDFEHGKIIDETAEARGLLMMIEG